MVGIEIIEELRKVDDEIKFAIANESSKLKQGLSILCLAQDRLNIDYLTANEIVEALDRIGVAADPISIARAFARAGTKIRTKTDNGETRYKAMLIARQEVTLLISPSGPQVIYIQNGKPRKARKQLAAILSGLHGTIRVCDKYYGERSLDVLEMFPPTCKVRFLTAITAKDKQAQIQRAISDFLKEHSNVEIRIYQNHNELHDRYIISSDSIWILGHGIKDIGNSESFIIIIGKDLGLDFISTMETVYDQRWTKAQPLS